MSFWVSFSILQGLGVLYLLVLFPFVIVLLDLLARRRLGGCQFLVMFLIWLLLTLVLRVGLLTVLMMRFLGFVGLF